MSVLSFVNNDTFIIRVFKHLETNPDNVWANSYEFSATASGGAGDLAVLAGILVIFEQNIHRVGVQFDRVVISTWEADSVPYSPTAFTSIPVTAAGLVPATDDLLALNTTLSVARRPVSGRFGHLFFRGALTEEEVTAPAGRSVLADIDAIQTRVDGAVTESGLDGYIPPGGEAVLALSMISADGETVRNVLGLTVLGVSALPTDHAWFNRTPAP